MHRSFPFAPHDRPSRSGRSARRRTELTIRPALLAAAVSAGCTQDAIPDYNPDAAVAGPVNRCAGKPDGHVCLRGQICIAETCTPARCGDGFVGDDEECDDGNDEDEDDCPSTCLRVKCGNGALDEGETCDDGNTADGDDCPSTCKRPVCGDGMIEAGEMCDGPAVAVGGSESSYSCNSDCTQKTLNECDKCAREKCNDMTDDGNVDPNAVLREYNYAAGCLTAIDRLSAAPSSDSAFLQECADVVNCSLRSGCGLKRFVEGDLGPEVACYCGEQSLGDCQSKGPTQDSPCATQWLAAGRTQSNTQMFERFNDLSYPVGWARFLLECYTKQCADVCVPK
jgi:cysteine-rich repeat protein